MRMVWIVTVAVGSTIAATARLTAQEATPAEPTAQPVSYEQAVAGQLAATPRTGSRLPADGNYCATCHTEPALWDADRLHLLVSAEVLAHDIHALRGVACSDCHGGDPTTSQTNVAHARDGGFRATLAEVQPACAHCHQAAAAGLAEGLHAQAGARKAAGVAGPLACAECHGASGHGIRPAADPASPLFLTSEVALCGRCHESSHATYRSSVHGRGLFESGLAVSATCSDCHDPHRPLAVTDERSRLHGGNVIQTCGNCHLFIQERLEDSVHRWLDGDSPAGERTTASGGTTTTRPVCTSCHRGHDLADPKSAGFRELLPGRCGDCHQRLTEQYRLSLHGQLTNLGHAPAATCADCHGAHDVLPVTDPQSRVFGARRVETCAQCHAGASESFAQFDPHADHRDPTRSRMLHTVYLGMEILLYSVFGFFGVHTLLWFVRSIIHRLRHGRPRRLQPGEMAYVRFEKFHRTMHVIVIVSFLGLALTGLPLKYSEHAWAQRLAAALGGFESTSFWHRVCAVLTAFYFIAHLVWLIRKIGQCRRGGMTWRAIFLGPDSMVPGLRDLRDMFGMFRWFFGLGKKPVFERWTYWEKFDYWAVFWGVVIIGTSGLLLWFPEFFTRFLPGQALNIAKVIHSEEALLATGFIFTIHFFNTHLRAEKFPMDMGMLTGLVSQDEMQDERPELVERLRRAGQLDKLLEKTPSQRTLTLTMLGGFVAVAIGLALLVGILVAVF